MRTEKDLGSSGTVANQNVGSQCPTLVAEPTAEQRRAIAEHPLATQQGLSLFIGLLAFSGALCPKCGHGTRKTSKRWAKCKKCGERVSRGDLDELRGAERRSPDNSKAPTQDDHDE